MLINTAGPTDWTKFVKEIENVESAPRNTQPVPMSAMGSQDQQLQWNCSWCGTYGHMARECRKKTEYRQNNQTSGWSGTDDKTKGKPGKCKDKQDTGKGKGKPSNGKGKRPACWWQVACFECCLGMFVVDTTFTLASRIWFTVRRVVAVGSLKIVFRRELGFVRECSSLRSLRAAIPSMVLCHVAGRAVEFSSCCLSSSVQVKACRNIFVSPWED